MKHEKLFRTLSFDLYRIPCKEILIRPNDKPWFASTIIKYKNRKRNIALRKQTPTSWLKYRRLRNKVNKLKKYATNIFAKILRQILRVIAFRTDRAIGNH